MDGSGADSEQNGAAAVTVWEWEDDLMYALPARVVRKCTRLACTETEPIVKKDAEGGGSEASKKEAADREGEGGGARGATSGGGPKPKTFASCARCGARFCSRECQIIDWKRGGCHKGMCPQLAAFRDGGFCTEQKRDAVLRGCLGRIRMYAFPFFVCHRAMKGDGALFLQSKNTLDDFFFDGLVTRHGEPLRRTVFASYVTLEEFDSELVAEDFELALSRAGLRRGLEACAKDQKRATILTKFRCGYVAVFTTQIVPDVAVCNALAKDYEQQAILQLNIDDG